MAVDKAGHERVYRMLSYMAWCDVELPREERELLEQYRERFELSREAADELEAQGRGGFELTFGKGEDETELLIDSVLDLAVADGRLALREQWRLLSLAKNLGLPERALVDRLAKRIEERGMTLIIETQG